MRRVLAVSLVVMVVIEAMGQPPGPTPVPSPLLPSARPAQEADSGAAEAAGLLDLPGGIPVSQPLQPTGPEPMPVVAPPASGKTDDVVLEVKVEPPSACGPLGPCWHSLELLYWWPARQPIPPLVFGRRAGSALSGSGHHLQLLAGGQAIDSQPSAGGRFRLGSSLNTEQTLGLEVAYFFLGTRSFTQNVRNWGGHGLSFFGLGYTDATTGTNELLTLGQTGSLFSTLDLSTSVRVQGWEVNTVANAFAGALVQLNTILGYRYFMANEGLRIEQQQYRYRGIGGIAATADQFDAHNRFHGGQVGLSADLRGRVVFCELVAKVAFGQNYQVVKTEGMTHLWLSGTGGTTLQTYGGSGILVQPSNFGRELRGVFAVLPEGSVKLGFRWGESGRLYVGYNFIYLSDAVRPGDQIDRTLNPAQIPLVSGAPPVYDADRPTRLFHRSDFWVQGVVIGLETRY
ncbi:MAG: BBP7 family outer membrane beta-barrel protein [Gemmataceae bacterium]|nr:BBP7 family outer membrane beta-barrel protein [Gemmata sp.]MDW8196681.1 BBP7 family outer membrane beta-barrel protein [Gemmataceae bacterium]